MNAIQSDSCQDAVSFGAGADIFAPESSWPNNKAILSSAGWLAGWLAGEGGPAKEAPDERHKRDAKKEREPV